MSDYILKKENLYLSNIAKANNQPFTWTANLSRAKKFSPLDAEVLAEQFGLVAERYEGFVIQVERKNHVGLPYKTLVYCEKKASDAGFSLNFSLEYYDHKTYSEFATLSEAEEVVWVLNRHYFTPNDKVSIISTNNL